MGVQNPGRGVFLLVGRSLTPSGLCGLGLLGRSLLGLERGPNQVLWTSWEGLGLQNVLTLLVTTLELSTFTAEKLSSLGNSGTHLRESTIEKERTVHFVTQTSLLNLEKEIPSKV